MYNIFMAALKINLFVPKTSLGKWSIALIIFFLLILLLLRFLIGLGESGGDTFFSNIKLALLAIFAGTSGILAFFIGVFAIIKKKERCVFVFLTTLIGFFILIFVAGEFLSPH